MQGQMIAPWVGGADGDAVVAWAGQHAMLTGRGLTIVVAKNRGASARATSGRNSASRSPHIAQAALPALTRDLRAFHPCLDIEVRVRPDRASTGPSRESTRADLLVIHSPAGPHLRLVGPPSTILACGTRTPVVHVPPPDGTFSPIGSAVVVAIGSSPAGRAALRSAAEEAARMACTLVAVAADSGTADLSRRHTLTLLQEVLADRPDVTTEVYWPADGIARTVTDLSRSARVVVVGNDVGLDRALHPLDPLAAALVRFAQAAVIVVGPNAPAPPVDHSRAGAPGGRPRGVFALGARR
jgi:hypothetical protein